MTRDTAAIIVAWFTEHGDNEFVQLPVSCPYSITSPSPETQCVLYTTKPSSVLHILEESGGLRFIQVIGRAGLPNQEDARWLQTLVGTHPVLFLGDNDPVDLLVFAWLRSLMSISYAGVGDSLLRKLSLHVKDCPMIPLTRDENEAVSFLSSLCPDYKELVGPQCSEILDRGDKIEIEAAILGCDRFLFNNSIIP